MEKKYDVIVVGAGPAGLVAARAIGENGYDVALLERKTDITEMQRACGQTLDHPFGYFHRDIYLLNKRGKRIGFPAHGFSVKYDGSYKYSYSIQNYSPGGNKIIIGIPEEQKKRGEIGKRTAIIDKEILLRCLLEETVASGVNVFPGINVRNILTKADSVIAEGSGDKFIGRYLIAADGVNSSIAEMMGFNRNRTFYGNLSSIMKYVSGLDVPDEYSHYHAFGFSKGGPVQCFVFPRPNDEGHIVIVTTMHPKVDLKEAWNHFTKGSFCTSWFVKAEESRTFYAVSSCRSPISEPYKDRVLLTGDVPSTLEVEITGAMIWGWQAGQTISLAIQEDKLGLSKHAISGYINSWQNEHIKHTSHEAIMKNFALPYALDKPDELDYIWSLVREPLPAPPGNNYDDVAWERGPFVEHLKLVMPIVKRERPELIEKIARARAPITELYSEVIKESKPVSGVPPSRIPPVKL